MDFIYTDDLLHYVPGNALYSSRSVSHKALTTAKVQFKQKSTTCSVGVETRQGWGCYTFYRRMWIGPHHRRDWWEMCLEAVRRALVDGKLSRSLALRRQSGPTLTCGCQFTRQAPPHAYVTIFQTVCKPWERDTGSYQWSIAVMAKRKQASLLRFVHKGRLGTSQLVGTSASGGTLSPASQCVVLTNMFLHLWRVDSLGLLQIAQAFISLYKGEKMHLLWTNANGVWLWVSIKVALV